MRTIYFIAFSVPVNDVIFVSVSPRFILNFIDFKRISKLNFYRFKNKEQFQLTK